MISCEMTFSSSLFTDKKQFPHYIRLYTLNKINGITISRNFYLITSQSICCTGWYLSETAGPGDGPAIASRSRSIGARSGQSWFPISMLISRSNLSFRTVHRTSAIYLFFLLDRSLSRSPVLDSRSLGASSERAIETESEPKESTVLRIAHRSRRSFLLSVLIFSLSLSPLSLSLSLFLPAVLSPSPSFSPFDPAALSPCSVLIHLLICLSIYLCHRSLFITPSHRAQPACSRRTRDTPLRDRVGGCRCEPPRR